MTHHPSATACGDRPVESIISGALPRVGEMSIMARHVEGGMSTVINTTDGRRGGGGGVRERAEGVTIGVVPRTQSHPSSRRPPPCWRGTPSRRRTPAPWCGATGNCEETQRRGRKGVRERTDDKR